MAETFNDALFDAMVAHQTGLLRFAGSVRNEIWKLLDATEADIRRQIASATGIGLDSPERVTKLNRLLEIVRETRLKGWKGARAEWFSSMRELAKAEPEFFDGIIKAAIPVELATVLPSAELLRDIVTSKPFMGKTVRQWADNVQRADLGRIEDQIKIGLVQNETGPQIARRIVGTVGQRGRDGVTQITRRQAAAITRTVVSGITSEARESYLQVNKELAPQKIFTATLDSVTTPICRRFDGTLWQVDDTSAPVFPLHFSERSLYSPVVDGEVVGERPRRDFTERQLLREYTKANGLEKVTKRAKLPHGTKGAYDEFARKRMRELTGTVPARKTYQSWLTGQSAEFQNDILGPTRGALFRRGGLRLERFVMRDGTELTLKQLASRHAAAFERAGLDPSSF